MRTMILVIVAAFAVVCGADKLDKVYLPPVSAKTAGGSARSLQPPLFRTFDQKSEGLPSGGYTNDYQGVIVDAVNPGTRATGLEQTGLGGPRSTYGSVDSKVGDAAFRESVFHTDDVASSRIAPGFESFVSSDDKTGQANFRLAPGFGVDSTSSTGGFLTKDQKSNTLKFNNEVGLDKYSYGYQTDNGIAVGEDGVDVHGSKAQGGYAFKSDDGKVYEVTYTADEHGYKPHGSHLPTPPPIPQSILVSLEKNAKEEAAGVVDDGSYDAQKYNEGGDYSNNSGNKYNDKVPSIGDKDATAGGSFGIQNDQPSFTASQGSSNYQSGSSGSQFGTSAVSSASSQQAQGNYKPFGVSGTKTETRFGSQSSFNKGSQTQGAFGKAPFGTPGFGSAFSSAVSSGSGSATAFAQAGPGFDGKYSVKQPLDSNYQGFDYAVNPTTPSAAIASASASDSNFNTQYSGIPLSEATASVEEGQVSSFASAQNSLDPEFSQSLNGNSGVSPALPTSATASASVTPLSSTVGSQQQQFASSQAQATGLPGQFTSGSATGSGYNGYQSQNSNKKPGQYTQNQLGGSFSTVKPASSLSSFDQKPTELVTPYEPSEKPSKPISTFNTQTSNQFGFSQFASQYPTQSFGSTTKPQTSQFGSSNYQSTFSQGNSGQYNSNKFGASQNAGASYSSSTQKPSYQEQGKDSSYHYKQPNKPFVTPKPQGTQFGSQFSGVSQVFGSTSPTLATQAGQYESTSSFNGVTQAEASSFPSGTPTTSTQFGNQASAQTGSTLLDRRPLVQSQSKPSSTFSQSSVESTVSTSQENEGTIYEYNKPAEVLPTPKPEQNKPGQVAPGSVFGSQFSQGSSQFSSQSKPSGTFQQTQTTFGSQSTGSFGQKPSSSTFGQKPFGAFQQSQFGAATGTQFGQKPSSVGTSFTSPGQPVQLSQTGQKPFGSSFTTTQQNKFSTSQLGQKPTSTLTGFGTSQVTQGQTTKPFGGSQSTSGFQQLGLSPGSQFGQKPQTTSGSSFTSNKYTETQAVQTTQFEQKPFGSSQTIGSTFQQTQFGVKPQIGSSFSTSSASQDQSTQLSQSQGGSSQTGSFQQTQFGTSGSSQFSQKPSGVQTSVSSFGQKPVGSSQFTSSSFQQTEFGSSTGSLLGQKPETQQNSFTATSSESQTQFGGSQSSEQQTQIGSTSGSTFDKQPSSGSSFSTVSSTVTPLPTQKPFGSSQTSSSNFEQSQFSSTGSSTLQQNQLGSGTTFGQKPQSIGSSLSVGTATTKPEQKPFGSSQTGGSTYQQSQFSSTYGSQFGQKPINQGSTFSSGSKEQSQFEIKPFGSSQTSFTSQQTQFGTSGTTFSQKPQSGSGFAIGTAPQGETSQADQKPFGSTQTGDSNQLGSTTGQLVSSSAQTTGTNFQQNQFASPTGSQFGQKPSGSFATGTGFQQAQGSFTGSQYGQKPQSTFSQSQFSSSTQQNQFGTSGSTFGQKPSTESTFNVGTLPQGPSTQTTQKPFGTSQTSFQQNQFGSSGSTFGQKPQTSQATTSTTVSKEQTVQTTQLSQGTFGSQSSTFGAQQNQLGQKPQTSFGTGFGPVQGQSVQPSQFGQKPFGSQTTDNTYQQNQFGSSSQGSVQTTGTVFTSQFPASTPKPQFGSQTQKPFSSIQSTQGTGFQQFHSSESYFNQKPLNNKVQSTGSVFGTQSSQSAQSQFGTQTQKPFGPTFQQNQFSQKPTSSANAFASTTGTGTQLGVQPFGSQPNKGSSFSNGSQTQKPSGSTSTQTGAYQPQKPLGSTSTQTGAYKPQKPFGSTLTQTGAYQPQKPFGSTLSQTGAYQPQKPFGSTSTQTGAYQPQKPVGSTTTQSGAYQPQKPFVNTLTQTGAYQPQKPFGITSTQTGTYQNQNPFGSTNTQTGAYQPQKPFGSTSTQTGAYQPQKPFGSTYTQTGAYQPQKPFSSTSTQTGAYQPQKPFGTTSTQAGAYQPEEGSTLTQTSGTYQPEKPFGSTATQTGAYQPQKPFGSTSIQTGAYQPQKPVGSISTQTGAYQPQKPFSNTLTQTGAYQPQKPFGSTSIQTDAYQPQKPFGSTYTQTGAYQPQKPVGSTSTQTGGYQPQKPFSNTLTQTGAYQPQKPFGSTSTQTGAYQPQKPFGSTSTQTGAYQPQKPFGSTSTQTGAYQPQKPFSSTSTQTGAYQPQKPFGSTSTQTGAYQPQKPFGSTFTQTGAYKPQKPFGSAVSIQTQSETLDQNVQPTQSSIQATGGLISSAQSSTQVGQPQKPFGSSGDSYSYQKPQGTIESQYGTETSRPTIAQKPQSTQANSFTSTSQTGSGSQTFKPFGVGSTSSPIFQTTSASAQSTDASEYVSSPSPQYSGFPFSSSAEASYEPTQAVPAVTLFGGQSNKPFGTFGQAQSTASSSGFGVQSAQSSAQTSQGSTFGSKPAFPSNVSFGAKPELSATAQSSVGTAQGQTLTGTGEQFGGPRDPPRFDKTGYHY